MMKFYRPRRGRSDTAGAYIERKGNMNKIRRKELQKAMELLEQAKDIIEAVKDEEQEAFDNMPESIQQSERGETMEEYIYKMDSMCDSLSDAIDETGEIVEG